MNYDGEIVATLFQQVDHFSADFVASTYANIVNTYSSVFYMFATIYIGLMFLNLNRGSISGSDFPFIILRTVCILTFAMNYHYFYEFVYDVVTNGPLSICKAIMVNGSGTSVSSINNALDNFIKEGMKEAARIFHMGSWSNITYGIFGFLILVVTIIVVVIAAGLIFFAKIGSAILLALSPIFIFFALYESTKGWFDSYIQHLFTYMLIPILTCAILMITLSVSASTINYMSEGKPSLQLLIPFIISCGIQIWLFLQIPQKCASLGSGFSLKGLTSSISDIKKSVITQSLGKSGKFIAGAMKLAVNQARKEEDISVLMDRLKHYK